MLNEHAEICPYKSSTRPIKQYSGNVRLCDSYDNVYDDSRVYFLKSLGF